ncbi:MAG: hypothetical protein IH841_05715 [Thaumarchaeota archaeon]|nr:hypothetical protein [Nitrososphaerota archaeon]
MILKEKIEEVAKLMRIELDDHVVYLDRVQKMIEYFDILDEADVESEKLSVQELPIKNLREDKHIPYEERIIDTLKNYKGNYIRAPKMI